MQVKDREDRQENPGFCDDCGTETKDLVRYYDYGPGHNVNWLCKYCSLSSIRGQERALSKTLGAMFNALEKELKK